jgi:heavy metal translocating P-type ATPase
VTLAHEVTAPAAVCDLCGLPLPSRPVVGGEGRAYCCHGCAHVAEIIEAVGEHSDAGRLALEAARERGLISTATPEPPRGPEIVLPDEARGEIRLRVEGLACPSCSWLVESVLDAAPGVANAQVDYLTDTARVVFDLRVSSQDALQSAVSEAGYRLAPMESEGGWPRWRETVRLSLAAIIAMNLMALAFVGYDSLLTGAENPFAVPLAWAQILLALPVVIWCALPIYRRAWAALRLGRVVMETLLSLGILAAAALSLVAALTQQPHLYLETVTMLVTLSLAGRALERHFKARAGRALTDLLEFTPTKARLAETGHFVSLDEIEVGDRVTVAVDEAVPLDLQLTERAIVREGLLTGEPHPVAREAGEVVLAGSRVDSVSLTGTVVRAAGETVADTMRSRVAGALRRTDESSRFADRLAQGFVPLVILIAAAALVGHMLSGAGAIGATLIAVSVLVVACPCAFGLAASLSLSLAVLRLARDGVLIKDPAALERLSAVDIGVFDKTGTITRGDLTLLSVHREGDEADEILAAVQAMECHSRHPIGCALSRLLPEAPGVVAEDIIEVPGMGITGTVNGRRIAAGRRVLFDTELAEETGASTRIWCGVAGERPVAHVDLADSLRPESPETVRSLAERGIASEMLSGDAPEPTRAAAREAGIDSALGGVTPERKAERVAALRAEGRHVLYVGDGFNDADAIAAADVGVALASGADLALISAPVVITRGDLRALVDLIDVARRAVRVLRGNFLWAFIYNVALLPVAALGFLAPIHAAALMAISSASVALHSLRMRSGSAPGRA